MHYSGVDFLKRTITALLFASVILFCILKGKVWFTGLFALCTLLATVEFTGLSNRYKKCNASPIWSAVTALLFYGAIAYTAAGKGSLLWFSSFILSLIIVFVREIYMKRPSPMADIAYTLFPILYIALPYALLSVLAYRFSSAPGTYSATIPLTLFIFLWCNDVGAYCIGCTIGRHKLFERISPKKTWEGSTGGALLTIAATILLYRFLPHLYNHQPIWVWLGMAFITVLFGTWGDLFESLLKREMGIKDSGHILPGHGGMLDRFDSALLAIPAVTVWFSAITIFL